MSRRTERVASILKRELAVIIMHELDDPRLIGLPSITRIKVSEDLSSADVFVTIMGTEGKQSAALNALKHSAGMMRSRLSADLEMRQVPYLKFHIDENLKKERQVLDILHQIDLENAAKEGSAPMVEAEADVEGAAPAGDELANDTTLGELTEGEPKEGEPEVGEPPQDERPKGDAGPDAGR